MPTHLSSAQLVFKRGESDIYEKILRFSEEFYQSRTQICERDDSSKVSFGARPDWIKVMLENPKIHDDDYSILSFLQDDNSIILDVGANWGYSAGAFKKLGLRAKIVSFEVISAFDGVLGEIKNLYPDSFHYFICGLGDAPSELNFVVPVVNGFACSGLCSACDSPHLPSLARNILFDIEMNLAWGDDLSLQFYEFTGQVCPLDQLVPNDLPPRYKQLPIEAIKIDVEGLECKVLSGGRNILEIHKPLVLAEGANRTFGISELMDSLGYIYAERIGNKLHKHNGMGQHSNGFFLHRDRLRYYGDLGVLDVSSI
jgi:FkbM family methyltransferase